MTTILPYAVGQQAVFTFSKAWVCPPDVTSIVATGFGGGGGGSGSASGTIGQGGGGGSLITSISIVVVPGTAYLITIGAGGTGGAVSTNGNAGGDTTFSLNGVSTGIWSGASGANFVAGGGGGGQPCKATGGGNLYTGAGTGAGTFAMGSGGSSVAASSSAGLNGARNIVSGLNGGTGGAAAGTVSGGSGGGAGPEGIGANGSAGSATTPLTGSSAAVNTGAGGGGCGAGTSAGFTGGAGGSGKLYINYVSKYVNIIQTAPPISNGNVLLLDSRKGISIGTNGVAVWPDQSSVPDINKNCLQTTGANQPIYTMANSLFAGKPSLDFNGTTDFLVSGTWNQPLVQPFTIIAVGVLNSTTGVQVIVDNLAGTTELDQNGGTAQIFAGSVLADTTATVLTNPFVFGGIYNGASSQLFLNKKTGQTVGAGGANGMTGMTIGSLAGGGSDWWNGSIVFVAAWNRTLSAAEMSAMMDWLGTTYGLTIGT
jgi:hypothetical protein